MNIIANYDLGSTSFMGTIAHEGGIGFLVQPEVEHTKIDLHQSAELVQLDVPANDLYEFGLIVGSVESGNCLQTSRMRFYGSQRDDSSGATTFMYNDSSVVNETVYGCTLTVIQFDSGIISWTVRQYYEAEGDTPEFILYVQGSNLPEYHRVQIYIQQMSEVASRNEAVRTHLGL